MPKKNNSIRDNKLFHFFDHLFQYVPPTNTVYDAVHDERLTSVQKVQLCGTRRRETLIKVLEQWNMEG